MEVWECKIQTFSLPCFFIAGFSPFMIFLAWTFMDSTDELLLSEVSFAATTGFCFSRLLVAGFSPLATFLPLPLTDSTDELLSSELSCSVLLSSGVLSPIVALALFRGGFLHTIADKSDVIDLVHIKSRCTSLSSTPSEFEINFSPISQPKL